MQLIGLGTSTIKVTDIQFSDVVTTHNDQSHLELLGGVWVFFMGIVFACVCVCARAWLWGVGVSYL